MKKPVLQKSILGCSITCVVFIIGRSYETVLEELGKERVETKGFYCREIIDYLKKLGFKAEFHYQNLWMDPWINFLKDKEIKDAKAGYRKRLPGKPIYGVFIEK